MVCDSVALVAGPLGLRDAICSDADLQAYLNLDDSLLQTIKMLVPERHEKPSDVIKVTGVDWVGLLLTVGWAAVDCGWGCC
jgi:hypothetical protein